MDHRSATPSSIPGQQALGLPQAHTQHARRRPRRTPARQHFGQDLNQLQILSAHLHPAQSVASNPDLRMGQRHFGFAELRHYCFAPTLSLYIICVIGRSGSYAGGDTLPASVQVKHLRSECPPYDCGEYICAFRTMPCTNRPIEFGWIPWQTAPDKAKLRNTFPSCKFAIVNQSLSALTAHG